MGAWVTADGRCETEIRTRIGMAKNVFSKRKELLTRGINKAVKKKIAKTVIWSVALYCAETWSLRKEDIRIKKNGGSENVDMEKHGTYQLDG